MMSVDSERGFDMLVLSVQSGGPSLMSRQRSMDRRIDCAGPTYEVDVTLTRKFFFLSHNHCSD